MLHHLRPGHLLLLHTEQILQVLGQLQRFGEAGSFWHVGAGARSGWSINSDANDDISRLIADFIRDSGVSSGEVKMLSQVGKGLFQLASSSQLMDQWVPMSSCGEQVNGLK